MESEKPGQSNRMLYRSLGNGLFATGKWLVRNKQPGFKKAEPFNVEPLNVEPLNTSFETALMKLSTCLFLVCALFKLNAHAQENLFTGTWQMEYRNAPDDSLFVMELQVASPEYQTLYPAQMKIQYGQFKGTYQLLLVKQANGQLAISRNKYAVEETPFALGNWMVVLNGSLLHDRGTKGAATLTAKRISAKRYGMDMPAIMSYKEADRTTVMRLSDFLRFAPLQLVKINAEPWRSADARKLLHSHQSPVYLGLIDSFYTNSPKATIGFSENSKVDNDSISLIFNGSQILDKMNINQPMPARELTLDTGLNLLLLFADNYGKVPPNTARLNVMLADKKFDLDFTSPENLSATFIAAKIFYYPDKVPNDIKELITGRQIAAKINQRKTILIDSITVQASEITLAIWDDAIEDGDSISLQINNEIYFPGIAVKKKPRFLPVKLYLGENKIIFIADNLGSIAPNTSILEIIDGKRRKSYMIDTNFGQNNAIKITYDLRGGQ